MSKLYLFTAYINFNFTAGVRNGLVISVPALPHYSWGEMLTLSFIDQVIQKPNLWHSSFSAKTIRVSNPVRSLCLRPSTSVFT